MNGKPKGRGEPEVTSARSRLDIALQDLVQRRDDSADEEPLLAQDSERPITPPFSSPKREKGEGKCSAKKRRRKEDLGNENHVAHRAYVMKFFDRSVDLAQFTESSNLYPLCRAWYKNDPQGQQKSTDQATSPPRDNSDQSQEEVYSLPHPDPSTCRDLRVPVLGPRIKTEELDIHAEPELPPEQLLLQHMSRWKHIRNSWMAASHRHEAQYSQSVSILKAMYDRQMKVAP